MRNALTQQLIGVELGMTVGFHEKIKDGVCLSTFLNLRDLVPICLGWQHVEVVDVLPWVCFSGGSTIRWHSLMPMIPRNQSRATEKTFGSCLPSKLCSGWIWKISINACSEHTSQRKNGLCTNATCINVYIYIIYIYINHLHLYVWIMLCLHMVYKDV